MPIYEYVCRRCGVHFSRIQKMGSNPAETKCEACGSVDVQRVVSACAVNAASSSGFVPTCAPGGGT